MAKKKERIWVSSRIDKLSGNKSFLLPVNAVEIKSTIFPNYQFYAHRNIDDYYSLSGEGEFKRDLRGGIDITEKTTGHSVARFNTFKDAVQTLDYILEERKAIFHAAIEQAISKCGQAPADTTII